MAWSAGMQWKLTAKGMTGASVVIEISRPQASDSNGGQLVRYKLPSIMKFHDLISIRIEHKDIGGESFNC